MRRALPLQRHHAARRECTRRRAFRNLSEDRTIPTVFRLPLMIPLRLGQVPSPLAVRALAPSCDAAATKIVASIVRGKGNHVRLLQLKVIDT